MLKSAQFWTLTAAGALALLLAAANVALFQGNRTRQAEATSRAQYIQQSIALETLYREIVKGLADRALRTRDEQVRALLADEGLQLEFDAPADAAPGKKEAR